MLRLVVFVGTLMLAPFVSADITIEIDRGYDNPKRIAVVPFGVSRNLAEVDDVADIVGFDLARSGQFAPPEADNMLSLPTRPDEVFFRDWRILKADYVLIGRTELEIDGNLSVSYHLYDVPAEKLITTERLSGPKTRLRDMAHLISDVVYEKITGIRGAFSTKILYVLAKDLGTSNARFKLEMADADGARARTLLESPEPILSTAWSPDGRRAAYVSFESGKPAIFVQEIASGKRQVITDFQGLNGAAGVFA